MQDVTTNEIMDFLKEHMLTKEEAQELFATRHDMMEFKSDILSSVDRFAKLHETLDQELIVLRGKYFQPEERLVLLERKLGIIV